MLQRGLRILPNSTEIYIEYCRLELLYREKIAQRMKLMGVDQAALVAKQTDGIDLSLVPEKPANEGDDTERAPEEDDGMNELLDVVPEGDPSIARDEADAAAVAKLSSDPKNPFFEGVIVLIIFNAAIAKRPSFEFRREFLSVVQQFDDTTHIQDAIYASFERDFPESEDALLLVARRPLDALSEEQKKNKDTLFNATRQALEAIDNELLVRSTGQSLLLLRSADVDYAQRLDTPAIRQKYIEELQALESQEHAPEIVRLSVCAHFSMIL